MRDVRVRYQIRIKPAGERESTVLDAEFVSNDTEPWPAPRRVRVDLKQFANRRVDIEFRTLGESPFASWGEPTLFFDR